MTTDPAGETYTVDHRLSDAERNIHRVWDRELDPILSVESGDVVRFECRDAMDGRIDVETTAADLLDLESGTGHPLTGPVHVEGAEPGDTLVVELLDLQHKGWGYNAVFPGEGGSGLLPEEFPDPALHVWDLEGDTGTFVDGIEVPLHPFPGVVGVAPGEAGEHATMPPRNVGGNMDVKHLTAGSTCYLPVEAEGALFSIGDCHAAQGDGEVCVMGIEAPMFVTARLSVEKGRSVVDPELRTRGPFTPVGRDEPMYGTTGIAPDLMEATKRAVRHMISHLHEQRGLSREEAYLLCSAAMDLKISQVVDAPNWTVTAFIAESLFPE